MTLKRPFDTEPPPEGQERGLPVRGRRIAPAGDLASADPEGVSGLGCDCGGGTAGYRKRYDGEST